MAARIQAKVLFGHVQLPKTDKLWLKLCTGLGKQ